MIQFILNNKPFTQTDREDLIPYYLNLGCEEVPVLYNGNLEKPIWNGVDFIEGASPEEIAEQQLKKQLEQQKILKQQQYEELKETDWYFTRFIETGTPVPEEILELRKKIRNKYNNDEDK
jgi:hypothetical protein